MRHLSLLATKFVMIAAVLGVTLGLIGGATFMEVLMAALVLSVVAYVVGDLIVLPATSNWVAVAADALIAWVILRMVSPDNAVGAALFWSIVAVAAGEYFFHSYLERHALRHKS